MLRDIKSEVRKVLVAVNIRLTATRYIEIILKNDVMQYSEFIEHD